jgi:hypothetical protein
VPLISNLDVWINIALIKQYHQNLSRNAAEREVLGYLRRYGLEVIAYKRNPALTAEQRFRVMLLRAAMVSSSTGPSGFCLHCRTAALSMTALISLQIYMINVMCLTIAGLKIVTG